MSAIHIVTSTFGLHFVADFYNSKGELIGNDGKSDGKYYLLKQTESSFDSKPGANGETAKVDNISKKELENTVSFIKTNSGDATAFTQDCIAYANSTEILPLNVLVDMNNAIATHPKCRNAELGGAIDPNYTIANFVVGETDNCPVRVRRDYDIAWFHSHIPDQKKHGAYNESILDRHDRYHAPSYSDTQLFKNIPGYVFDFQNNRIYLLKDGLIKG